MVSRCMNYRIYTPLQISMTPNTDLGADVFAMGQKFELVS